MIITAVFHKDRSSTGLVFWVNPEGALQFAAAYGKSDNATAKTRGNEARDSRKPFGDVPTGLFAARVIAAGDKRYGPNNRIELSAGLEGDAAIALGAQQTIAGEIFGGRWGLLIHGGPLSKAGGLRPTYGCIRLTDEDMRRLISDVAALPTGEKLEVAVSEVTL